MGAAASIPDRISLDQAKAFAEASNKILANNKPGTRSTDHMERTSRLQEIFEDDEILFSPLLERCPRFIDILRFILENKFSFRVKNVDWTKKMTDWGEEECKIVGRSLAAFIIGATAGEHATTSSSSYSAPLHTPPYLLSR